MRKAIVAIGGGRMRARAATAIDREILRLAGRLSGKKHPKVLYIPTANSDEGPYWKRVQAHFGTFLKCETDVLFLIREKPSHAEIRKKISWAEVIYVGGGNTLMMMRLWRRLGVDKLLRAAYEKGTVLSGISAGSICWFESGHSDSMSFYNSRKWEYINVKGLEFLPGIHCPHYNGRTGGVPRRENFQKMIRRIGGMGIAMENNCAIEFIDGKFYRVIRSKRNARTYRVYKSGGEVIEEEIRREKRLAPVVSLYHRRLPG